MFVDDLTHVGVVPPPWYLEVGEEVDGIRPSLEFVAQLGVEGGVPASAAGH